MVIRQPMICGLLTCLLSACATSTTRSDLSAASDSFGKALDSANTYIQKRATEIRRETRENTISARDGQLKSVLAKNTATGTTEGWRAPVDAKSLLCRPQQAYAGAVSAWTQLQSLRQPLSDLSQESKDTGFSLFYSSIRNKYAVAPPVGTSPEAGEALTTTCQADFDSADSTLGNPLTLNPEATGLPYVDTAVAAYQALDVFFGALGSLIDDSKRTAALKQWLNDRATQQTFKTNVTSLQQIFASKMDNSRLTLAQAYVVAYLRYKASYESMTARYGKYPADVSQRVIKVYDDFGTALENPETGLLSAADAYDAALVLKDADQFKALQEQFDKLVELSNKSGVSVGAFLAEAQRIGKVFDDGKDAYAKYKALRDDISSGGTGSK